MTASPKQLRIGIIVAIAVMAVIILSTSNQFRAWLTGSIPRSTGYGACYSTNGDQCEMLSILDCEKKYGRDRSTDKGEFFTSTIDIQNFVFADGDNCPKASFGVISDSALADLRTSEFDPSTYCSPDGRPNVNLRKLCFEGLQRQRDENLDVLTKQPLCNEQQAIHVLFGPVATGYTSTVSNDGSTVANCAIDCHLVYECIEAKPTTPSP